MADSTCESDFLTAVDTEYWHKLGNGDIQCDLCPRFCKLKNGQRGLCFVRANYNNKVVLTTYGRSSGFCIDPIEKKPLNHFYPGTPVLSFGTAGCNLACKFCQNWDISKSREMNSLMDTASPEQLASAAVSTQCKSVAYTYNDPVIFHEYAIDVAEACSERGIKNVAVTAAYMCEKPRNAFFARMDAANVDLKAFSEDFYYRQTGSHLKPILDNLIYIKHHSNTWLELTTLVIPGLNDSTEALDQLTRWVARELGVDTPLHFSAFHPDYKMRDKPPTPAETLYKARDIGLANGLRYVYTGNIHDRQGGSTYCHQCNTLLIERDWYVLGNWHLTENGRCKTCNTPCAGIFEKAPGNWGAKRVPVRVSSAI